MENRGNKKLIVERANRKGIQVLFQNDVLSENFGNKIVLSEEVRAKS